MESIVIFGCSGHAKVIIEAIESEGKHHILGCLGATEEKITTCSGYPVLGDESMLASLLATDSKIKGIIAIGDNKIRRKVATFINSEFPNFTFINIIHPKACVAKDVHLSVGNFIAAGAVINAGAILGSHIVVNTNASIDHDCSIADFAFIGPNAALGGHVCVGCETFIGIGASVIQAIHIGEYTTVGAGAVVISNLPSHVSAIGVPAKHG